MNLLVPCAGRSTRFKSALPKYLLAMHDGSLMCDYNVRPFLGQSERVCFGVLKEHADTFGAVDLIRQLVPGAEVTVFEDVTRGQAETVKMMIDRFSVRGPFLVKDCDSHFVPREMYQDAKNYVSVCSVREIEGISLHNKGFVNINEQGYIVGMVEKRVRSELFSCGGYFFSDPEEFNDGYRTLNLDSGECYLSAVIDAMIQDGVIFHPMRCQEYVDLGTEEDWVSHRRRYGVYIFDLDGVVFENGSHYFQPRWGENSPIAIAAEKLRELFQSGQYIILMTARPETFREVTEGQLDKHQIPYHQLVMGVFNGRRSIINDYSHSNPYPACVAINTARDSGDFVEKL